MSKSAASAAAPSHRALHPCGSARLRNLAALPAHRGSGPSHDDRPLPQGVTASRAVCLRPDLARWRGEEESTTMGGKRLATTALAFLVALVGRAPGVGAAIPRGAGPTPPRVSVTERDASVSRPGAEGWGQATLVPADGEATDVGPDKQVVLEGSDTPQLATNAAPDPDEWDRWNLDRSGHEGGPSPSARYVSPEVTGAEDLDRNGDWRETPRYGHVWVPHDVPPDWAPYSTGRWIFDPYYGWTWVDDAPWGWAPYHYGRWVYGDGFWGWAPGPVVVAPVYAPALVSFFGAPGVGVSVGVGFPFVSWVALGFGEPVIPWWGPVGFAGRCWWGGWGGPRIVNNVVIQHNTYVNVRNVTVFQNTHVHNAVIAVNRDHFGRGHVEHVRLAAADVKRLRPIHGNLGVKPTPASLVAKEGHSLRPPQAVHARPVVATRPPQDHSQHLRAAGLNPPASATPPPRLVHAPRPQGGGRQASPGGRATPPSPPGAEHRRLGQAGARPAPPPERARSERPNPGGPHEHGAPHAPAAAGQPHGGTRAPEHA